MPTAIGAETIGERLTRLRTELAGVRTSIARTETNGASFSMGGVSVSSIAHERLLERAARLEAEITGLEARVSGVCDSSRVAVTRTTRLTN